MQSDMKNLFLQFMPKPKDLLAVLALWFVTALLTIIGYQYLSTFDPSRVPKYLLIACMSLLPYSLSSIAVWSSRRHKSMALLLLLPFFYILMVFVNYRHFMLTAYCGEIYHIFSLTATLSCIFLLLENRFGFMKFLRGVIEFIFYSIIATVIAHALVTGASFNNEAVIAICQTNLREAVYYFWNMMHGLILLIALLILIGLILFVIKKIHSSGLVQPISGSHKILISASLLLILLFLLPASKAFFFSFNKPLLCNTLDAYRVYHEEIDRYNEIVKRRQQIVSSALKEIDTENIQKPAGIVVMVIGESLNKNYMSCYGKNVDTTPFQKSIKGQKGFYFYDKAFACDVQTAVAVPHIITGINQYLDDDERKLDITKLSIIDIAKEIGYKTIWISTQAKVNSQNSRISSIAIQSDNAYFLDDTRAHLYDIRIMDTIKQIDFSEPTLLIIHLNGNHFPYGNKYPKDFDFPADVTGVYEKSVYYNDYVLKNVFEFFKDKQLDAFLYVSDHSDAVSTGKGHDPRPEKFTHEMIEIPLWIFVPENYGDSTLKEKLARSTDYIITNDLLFNFMLDVMGLPQFKNQRHFSPLADDYYLLSHEPLTLNGKRPVKQ